MYRKTVIWSFAMVCALVFASVGWAAMPQEGRVDGLFQLRWKKPHVKGSKLYLTLTNDGDVFQPLKAKLHLEAQDGSTLRKAVFDLGIPAKKSIRAYGLLEGDGDLSSVSSMRWVFN